MLDISMSNIHRYLNEFTKWLHSMNDFDLV